MARPSINSILSIRFGGEGPLWFQYINYFGGSTFILQLQREVKCTTLPPPPAFLIPFSKHNSINLVNAAAAKPVTLQSLATADFSPTITYNGNWIKPHAPRSTKLLQWASKVKKLKYKPSASQGNHLRRLVHSVINQTTNLRGTRDPGVSLRANGIAGMTRKKVSSIPPMFLTFLSMNPAVRIIGRTTGPFSPCVVSYCNVNNSECNDQVRLHAWFLWHIITIYPTPNIFNKEYFCDRSREISVFFESSPLH